jgi:hypothetical protein
MSLIRRQAINQQLNLAQHQAAFGDVSLSAILGQSVDSIGIETTIFPEIKIDEPLKSKAEQSFGPMNLIRPKFTVKFPGVPDPMILAPWGEPKINIWPLIIGLALFGVGSLAWTIGKELD